MILSKLLYYLVPKKAFSVIRQKYFLYKKKLSKPLTEQNIRDILINKMGVSTGKTVFVHSSMNFLNIDFSPNKLLNILIELVGSDGTLIFPAWHFNYRAEDYLEKDLVFDIQRSPSALGLLSELARRHKGAIRSVHPTTSIVAIGKHAKEMTEEHQDSIYPCGEKSPYYKMMKYDAIIIGLGVTTHFISFLHCPEDILGEKFPVKTRTDKVFEGKVKLKDGQIITVNTLAAYAGIGKRDIPRFLKKYLPTEAFSSFTVNGNSFYIAHSKPFYNKIVELANNGKTIYGF